MIDHVEVDRAAAARAVVGDPARHQVTGDEITRSPVTAPAAVSSSAAIAESSSTWKIPANPYVFEGLHEGASSREPSGTVPRRVSSFV